MHACKSARPAFEFGPRRSGRAAGEGGNHELVELVVLMKTYVERVYQTQQ